MKQTSSQSTHSQEKVKQTSPQSTHSQEKVKQTSPQSTHSQEKVKQTSPQSTHSQEKVKQTSSQSTHSQEKVKQTSSQSTHSQEKVKQTSPQSTHSQALNVESELKTGVQNSPRLTFSWQWSWIISNQDFFTLDKPSLKASFALHKISLGRRPEPSKDDLWKKERDFSFFRKHTSLCFDNLTRPPWVAPYPISLSLSEVGKAKWEARWGGGGGGG